MTSAEYEINRQRAFQEAMAGLVMDGRFTHVIDVIREYREMTIRNLFEGNVIGNERATLACIGELRAYDSILSIYEDFRKRGAEVA